MIYYPMKLSPCYKHYLWGGRSLNRLYNKKSTDPITAESWELCCHRDGKSVIANGLYTGWPLAEIVNYRPVELLGARHRGGEFPILVKLIDAEKDLSIQVHPSDLTAHAELGEQGKAEMWYVLEARPNSYIYYGFKQRMSYESFIRNAQNGTICNYLNRVEVKRGDVFYILPGTIHAICSGIVIAEIQQNSNTTFRVYDYQRRDAQGNMRQLHLERAAEVVNYSPIVPGECKVNNVTRFENLTLAQMFSCEYFCAYRVSIKDTAHMRCYGDSFQHLLFVDGEGILEQKGKHYSFRRGDSYFLPATMGDYKIYGACTALLSKLP